MAKTANPSIDDALSDAVWDRAASGDESAIVELYERFMPSLISFAQRRNAEDPEGSANLAFYDGVKALPNLRARNTPVFRAYIYRAIRNRIAGQRRRRSLATVPLPSTADSDVPNQPGTSPEDLVVSNARFDSMLSELTPAQREVIHHRFLSGHTVAETARMLDRSPASVRGLQERSLARLRALSVLVVAVLVGLGMYLLSQDDTPVVTDTPTSEPPPVSTPDEDASGEIRVELGGDGEDSLQPDASSTASTVTTAPTATTESTVAPEPVGVSLRPSSAPEMCLGFNESVRAVELQDCRESPNQLWDIRPSGVDGYVELAVMSSGRCMHVENYSSEDGARIVESDCGLDQDNALWEYSEGGPLVAKHSGKCVTVDGNSRHEGAPVSVRGCGIAAYQLFSRGA